MLSNAQVLALQASRVRENDYISIPKDTPSAVNWKAWWRTTVSNTATASGGFYDQCYRWMLDIETLTFEQLADTTPFPSIDAKLGTAVSVHFHGRFQRWLDLETEKAKERGQILRGRQMVHYLLHENEAEVETMGVQAHANAQLLQCPRVENLEQYLLALDTMVRTAPSDFTDVVLESLLLKLSLIHI